MRIRNFLHKGLKELYTEDRTRRLPAGSLEKLRKMLAFLESMSDPEEIRALPHWTAHPLAGSRKGLWSLHVTRNWRLTFRVDPVEGELCDVDFEDYH